MGKNTFDLAGREFPAVTWYTDPGLRKTYICLFMVILTSATNGYDGSMMNGLQVCVRAIAYAQLLHAEHQN